MKQVRLLPIVVMAASALLVLKTIGIVMGTGYTLGGVNAAWASGPSAPAAEVAQVAPAETAPVAPAVDVDPETAAANAAAEALFGSSPASGADGDIPGTSEDTSGATEAVILERLAERRAELEAFEAELQSRLAVVEAAEIRLEERLGELGAIEAEINAMVSAREAQDEEQFAAVVAMYEAMRAGDAATIFNDLDIDVLVRVGRAMNPRKLGPIMAEMATAKAQQLTVMLAQTNMPQESAPPSEDYADLPQIVGQ